MAHSALQEERRILERQQQEWIQKHQQMTGQIQRMEAEQATALAERYGKANGELNERIIQQAYGRKDANDKYNEMYEKYRDAERRDGQLQIQCREIERHAGKAGKTWARWERRKYPLNSRERKSRS